MIEHINFVERQAFIPTYRKLATIAGAVVAGLLALYGVAFGRVFLAEHQSAVLTAAVNDLKTQREKVLAEVQKGRGGPAQGDDLLRKAFRELPRWSELLRELTQRMPAGVWLVSFKTYQKEGAGANRGVILSGEAEDARQVSLFLEALVDSRYFENPLLTTSKREDRPGGAVYTFTIDSGLGIPGGAS